MLPSQLRHCIAPVAGAGKATKALRPGGRADAWSAGQPSRELTEALAEIYRRTMADSLAGRRRTTPAVDGYPMPCTQAFGVTAQAGALGELKQWRSDSDQPHARHQRADQLATLADRNQFPPVKPPEVLDGAGATIHTLGGSFTMRYAPLLVTVRRTGAAGPVSRSIRRGGKPKRGHLDATGATSARTRPGPKRLSRCGRTSPSSWRTAISRDRSPCITSPGEHSDTTVFGSAPDGRGFAALQLRGIVKGGRAARNAGSCSRSARRSCK
jgi:hypothetical protein